MDQNVQNLIKALSRKTTQDIFLDQCDDTFEVEADRFSMTFVIEGDYFEIRNIDVRGNSGLGRSVISTVHDFCDECGLEVCACTVRPEAEGFWRKMGYEEGTNGSEFFRVM